MNTRNSKTYRSPTRARGFSIVEALVAALILAIGMLALAALQSALVKASANSKTQSAALALAMQSLENLRSYRNAAGWRNDIVDVPAAATTVSVGGQTFTFTRAIEVDRFNWVEADASNPARFVAATAAGAETAELQGKPAFKRAQVIVSWTTEDNESREVRLSDVFSSIMPSDSGSLVARPASARRTPPVRIYTPSEPGIIPIAIGDDQASASSNPKPVQFDTDGGATLTRFNVQTYLNDGNTNPLLQRRIEFSLAACQCKSLASTSSATNPLYEPSVWTGDKYSTPRVRLGRPMATAVQQINDNQDVNRFDDICTACCRDHQNGTDSVNARTSADADPTTARPYNVDPFRAITEYEGEDGAGPMKRYMNTSPTAFQNPTLTEVTTNNQVYLQTCRLVRVDGINRVTTDARLENYTVVNMDPNSRTNPDDTLATLPSALVTKYGEFAKEYVESALGIDTDATPPDVTLALPNTYPVGGLPNQLIADPGPPTVYTALANTYDAPTGLTRALLDLNGDDTVTMANGKYHNLHARGLYIDFLSTEARQAIACVGSTARTCLPYRDRNPLELVPFFAVNLTNLTLWRRPDPPAPPGVAPPAKLSISPNGFPQTYGENFIRGRIKAEQTGDEVIRGSSRVGNEGLTDQIATYTLAANPPVDEPEPFTVSGTTNETTYRFLVRWTCPSCVPNDDFYTKMGLKQLNSSPDGSSCSYESDNSYRNCALGTDPNVNSVDLTFAKYVVIKCVDQGADKGTFNPATGQCEKANGTVQPIAETLNYQFCGLRLPTALSALGVTSSTTSAGTPNGSYSEVATARISGATLGNTLPTTLPSSSPSAGAIEAVFVREGVDTCPVL